MNREEWVKAVKKALIDKDENLKKLAEEVNYSYAHVTNILAKQGKGLSTLASKRLILTISEHCGIEPYEEGEDDSSKSNCTCDNDKCGNGECRCR